MSGLEDRCVAFHEAALGSGKSKGPAKEMATLRRFLHKNQSQRFSDKATARLFDTIQLYATNKELPADDRESLLEDALKLPFTVFTTKQKKTMLKWIEEIRGANNTPSGAATAGKEKEETMSVVDIVTDDDTVYLMPPSVDDMLESTLSQMDPSLRGSLQSAFEANGQKTQVQVVTLDDPSKRKIVGLQVQT